MRGNLAKSLIRKKKTPNRGFLFACLAYNEFMPKKANIIVELSNGTKLELGPHLSGDFHVNYTRYSLEPKSYKKRAMMEQGRAQELLSELNQSLSANEKTWRILTKEDFIEIGRPIQDKFASDPNQPIHVAHENFLKRKEYFNNMGFTKSSYWTSTKDPINPGFYWSWRFGGFGSYNGEGLELAVRCCREV